MEELFQWSSAKARTDPLALVLAVYVVGYLPALLTSLLLSLVNGSDVNIIGVCFRAIYDATIWPLKVAGF
ncbi:MAG: hypothetical protein E5V41_16550 [Mesorhizobium sp.]|nr:MAG: hypothetical protein E5V41_16550 [Mesorhizobium sp.]